MRQPTVSHHLKVLREAGWVRAERRGHEVYYSIEPEAAERFHEIASDLAQASAVASERRTRKGSTPDAPTPALASALPESTG